jgi:hypothetical protein
MSRENVELAKALITEDTDYIALLRVGLSERDAPAHS